MALRILIFLIHFTLLVLYTFLKIKVHLCLTNLNVIFLNSAIKFHFIRSVRFLPFMHATESWTLYNKYYKIKDTQESLWQTAIHNED